MMLDWPISTEDKNFFGHLSCVRNCNETNEPPRLSDHSVHLVTRLRFQAGVDVLLHVEQVLQQPPPNSLTHGRQPGGTHSITVRGDFTRLRLCVSIALTSVPAAGVAAQLHHQPVGLLLAVLAAPHVGDGLLKAVFFQNLGHAGGEEKLV